MKIKDYAPIVGNFVIDDLKLLAEKLKGKSIQHVNSTAVGGGVAEILNRMVPLLADLGVENSWDVIKGGEKFFEVTKKFHNALHGKDEGLTRKDLDVFLETGRSNEESMDMRGDIVFIHDPQPITLINRKKGNKWLWRCHVDVSAPDPYLWKFLDGFISKYDSSIFSAPAFSRKLSIRQFLIAPSIDPLSDKNKELPAEEVSRVLEKYNVPRDKPLITQISRFDRLKDPVGVIEAYKLVKKNFDCRLILAGGTASDDPEGIKVLDEVRERAQGDEDILILLLPHNDIEINALQTASDIILQKSLKEGFGLTISEALWKSKAVVASNVGGIPLQIKHGYTGSLCNSVEGAAYSIKKLLSNPGYAAELGKNGREHVKQNFLLTRHLRDYMMVFLSLYHPEDIVCL
ncbi:MAG: glycosyltransferase [Candidatus Omnitrophota bacterium]